ncbi:MAG: hypothetical protein J6R47_05145 [Acholeplasmatales bacterium]|nr:hypothetical protein [Acholeplasmatales bacterium]
MIKLHRYIDCLVDFRDKVILRDFKHRILYRGPIMHTPTIYDNFYIIEMKRTWIRRRLILTIIEDINDDGNSKKD